MKIVKFQPNDAYKNIAYNEKAYAYFVISRVISRRFHTYRLNKEHQDREHEHE